MTSWLGERIVAPRRIGVVSGREPHQPCAHLPEILYLRRQTTTLRGRYVRQRGVDSLNAQQNYRLGARTHGTEARGEHQ